MDSLPNDVDALKRLLREQQAINAQQAQTLAIKQTRIDQLEEWLRLVRQRQFGRRSEKHTDQLEPHLFNEAELLATLPDEGEPVPAIAADAG